MKILRAISVCISSIICLLPTLTPAAEHQPIKNVILFIGDGMGMTHVLLARYYSMFILGQELTMTQIMHQGATAYMTNYPLKHLVTDSAAAATALATGHKTLNGMISMTLGNISQTTVLEQMHRLGKSAGLVSTTRLTHATPAAFAAHVPHRDQEDEIALQMLNTGAEVMLAGGRQFFMPRQENSSKRQDKRNLYLEAQQADYTVVKDAASLRAVPIPATKKLLGLFNDSHMNYAIDRDDAQEPSLSEMTKIALAMLRKNEKGFFLMVESGLIDQAAHMNDAASVMREVLEFDKAIAVGSAYTEQDPNTLLIVTADHETGGMTMTMGTADPEESNKDNDYMTIADLRLLGKAQSSFHVIDRAIKNTNDLAVVKQIVEQATNIQITKNDASLIKENKPVSKIRNLPVNIIGQVIADKLSIQWSTAHHSGAPVMLFAIGPYSEKIKGFLDNTDVAKLIFAAL